MQILKRRSGTIYLTEMGAFIARRINLGWPTGINYWSSTADERTDSRYYKSIRLTDDSSSIVSPTATNLLTCQSTTKALASQIAFSSPQFVSELDAVRTPIGSKISLQVTTKDARGNPVPKTAFRLTKDRSTTRSGVIYDTALYAGYSGSTLKSVTTFYGVTDDNGQAQLEFSQDLGKGVKTPAIFTLDSNTAVSATMPMIFTVATSPDSPKAYYWGHMPETLQSSDGSVFKRPRLFDELAQTSGYKSASENGETWALFTYAQAQSAPPAGCDEAHIPTRDSLSTLYNTYPGGAVETAQGWPTGKSFWSSTVDGSSHNIFSLYSGSVSSAQNDNVYLTCLDQAKVSSHLKQNDKP